MRLRQPDKNSSVTGEPHSAEQSAIDQGGIRSTEQSSSKRGSSQPILSVAYIATAKLRPNPNNPRIHTDKQIRQLAQSIEAFGFDIPVLVDRHLQLIVGHGRLQAAKRLGMEQLPAIILDHLTPTQAMALMIADNKLTENSRWDEHLLAEQIKFLSGVELNFSLEATGFEVGEIDVLIDGLAPAHEDEPDPADVVPEVAESTPVTKPGDLWLLNHHRVLCNNSLNENTFQVLMENSKAAMIFVDPPYNVPIAGHATGLGSIQHRDFAMATGEMSKGEFTDFLAQNFRLLARYSTDGSIHYVSTDWRHTRELLDAGQQIYSELKNLCVWVKDNGGMGTFYRSQHELIFVFKAGRGSHRNNFQLGQYGRYRTNVWQYAGVNSFSRNTEEGNLLELHPTVKPVALVADAIMDVTSRGDIVLDAFLGSGTTVIAAERTGRACYGIEIDPAYVDTVVRRWQAFTGKAATHGTSGRSFTELEQEVANATKR
jgi:ParB/RepB/Spo0J family partition protein